MGNDNKNTINVEAKIIIIYAKIQFHTPFMAAEKIFEYFFENLSVMLPRQPIKFSNLDKIHINIRGLLKKRFCKKSNYQHFGQNSYGW